MNAIYIIDDPDRGHNDRVDNWYNMLTKHCNLAEDSIGKWRRSEESVVETAVRRWLGDSTEARRIVLVHANDWWGGDLTAEAPRQLLAQIANKFRRTLFLLYHGGDWDDVPRFDDFDNIDRIKCNVRRARNGFIEVDAIALDVRDQIREWLYGE